MASFGKGELVRIDDVGAVHAVGKMASQRLRARKGAFRMMPSPPHVVFMRFVGEDGARDAEDGAIVRLCGEITAPGALVDIVALISQAAWRGELVVATGDLIRSVFFDGGNVVSAVSNAPGERVGEVMYKLGALTEQQISEVMLQISEGHRFGEIAISRGFLTRERLFRVMRTQMEEIVFACLRVGDGMFYFLDDFDESKLASHHHANANGLIMEGVRRMDEIKYFRDRIPSDKHVPIAMGGKGAPPDAFASVYAAIDGKLSVADLGRQCGLTEFEITQAIFQLVQAGFVKIAPPQPTNEQALVAIFNDIMREVASAVARHGQLEILRAHLESFASNVGVYDALFLGAGPSPTDFSLNEDRVKSNVSRMAGEDAMASLTQWLYDYASFALFDASSMLPKTEHVVVTNNVNDRLNLLVPKPVFSSASGGSALDIIL